MAAVPTLERTTFRTSRLLEFCSRKELVAQTGHEPEAWPLVVLKELIDNALDACEEAGIAPEIRIKLTNSSITVTDNGPGIAPETIASILDFTTRTSSREAYVSPTRGAQGNALKTIFAMPFVLDGAAGCVGIISRGIRHKITFKIDQIRQEPVIDQARQEVTRPVRNGSSITVTWPVSACSALEHERWRILQLASAYGFINPHLRLTIAGAGSQDTVPSDRAWQKWKPCDPTSPHWYEPDHLERLIGAYLSHDAEHGRERTVREFITEFRGLSGTAKQKAVLDATGLSRAPLSRLLNGANAFDREAVGSLLQAMAINSKPVRPEALGIIGEDHLRAKFEAAGCAMDSFRCKTVKGSTDGVPWIIEAAFAWRPSQDRRPGEDGGYTNRQLITGVNWSPGMVNPFRSLGYGRGLESLLAEKFAGPREPVVVLVHLACPRVTYTDRGKSAIVMNSRADADALLDVVTAVTRTWTRQRKAELRDRSREISRRDALARRRRVTIKDAAWQVMGAAYRHASANGTLPANARQIMYAARPDILRLTRREQLDDDYFTQTLLPDYMAEHPDETAEWDVVYDARGHFAEPHTDRLISLGTINVRGYLREVATHAPPRGLIDPDLPPLPIFPTCGPKHRYDAVLFLEKEGFGDLLRAARIAERYDLAIMSTKGLSNTAARRLVDHLCAEFNLPLLVLHDFDRSGFSIVGTLQRATRRYTFKNDLRVIDIGLRLADVDAYDLQTEPSTNVGDGDIATLRLNGANDEEIYLLRQARVELNAFTSDQFVVWLESKLKEHGVTKVVPDDAALELAYRRSIAARYFEDHAHDLIEAARRHAAAADLPSDLRSRMEQALQKDPARSWHAVLRGLWP